MDICKVNVCPLQDIWKESIMMKTISSRNTIGRKDLATFTMNQKQNSQLLYWVHSPKS